MKSINKEMLIEIEEKSKKSDKWLKEIDTLNAQLKQAEAISTQLEGENKLKAGEISKLAKAL